MSSTPYTVSPDVTASVPKVDSDFAELSVTVSNTSPWGLSSQTEMQALVDQVAKLTAALKALGFISAS